ncbi:hypothetical protein TbrSNM41_15140 [Thermus brockianus]|uniref:Uncharacterized protein n=1 Tax=Thermus brockianus TaxID=56956 RepID=A0ABM7XKE5_THEBO|nr:hypothetical protein TbrSNM41_15140 [Thermus brockianus]
MKLHLHRADAVDENPFASLLEFDPGGVGLGEGEGVVASPSLEPGITGFSPFGPNPTKEALKSPVYSLDDLLQDLGVDLFVLGKVCADLGEPSFLLAEGKTLLRLLVGFSPLLESGVVELAAEFQGVL